MRFLVLCFLVAYVMTCRADYLQVYPEKTWIKKTPRSSAEKIHQVYENELLELLDDGIQTRGYYHVRYPNSNITGYIYRSIVKRMPGDFPRFIDSGESLEITVIDVGAGMSALVRLPNDNYMVFDAGLYNRAYDYINRRIDEEALIEYMILSHTDADHWGSAKEIIETYDINTILRTDFKANNRTKTLNDGVAAISNNPPLEKDWNISKESITPGYPLYDRGGVQLYFLMGFGEVPDLDGWDKLSTSKKNNGVSIVAKLVYGDYSILFTGDAVGRKDGKDGCIVSEKFMLDTLDAELLDADVLVAAHHGADNGNCMDFIEAVSPEYVIFPAGHKHRHPRKTTAERFIDYGVLEKNIYRTDYLDKEVGGSEPYQQEWDVPYTSMDRDIDGDDHVRIVFPERGNIQIGYEWQVN